ncbi:Hypothetical predicted protein, partial [Paramuricea clavata]
MVILPQWPALLLQKPHPKSKAKEHTLHLNRRLKQWMDGNINGLLDEDLAIQKRLVRQSEQRSSDDTARVFAKLIMQDKVRAALRIISEDNGECLTCDSCVAPDNPKIVRQVLLEKHPPNIPPVQSAILNGDCNMEPHPVIFYGIDGALIQNTAIKTEGAAWPSGLDAMAWRRL